MSPVAPPLAGSVWINTPGATWSELTTRPLALVFWSSHCDASLHLLRQLEDLAQEFAGRLGFVAVHSPRRSADHPVERIADTVARLRLRLPVLHDPQLDTFHRYSPGGWPATIFVDRHRRVTGAVLGSDGRLCGAAAEHLAQQDASERFEPLKVGYRPPPPRSALAWPDGVAVLDDGRVAVSDYGHDRVLVGRLDPQRPALDIDVVAERIDRPGRLVALSATRLAVCQPDSGRVSLLDLHTSTVTVLADGMARPVAACVDADGSLVVSDAGDERLLRIALHENGATAPAPIAGSGASGETDGPGGRATLSQPNGMCRTERGLLFADAASNNLRLLSNGGKVTTPSNGSVNRAGLADGHVADALFDRPVDLAARRSGSIAVLDHGNSRVRLLDGRQVNTVPAAGLRGPEAIATLADGRLVVADTGNHRIVLLDPIARTASVVALGGMEPMPSRTGRPKARGVSGMGLRVSYPAPGTGPWQVRVEAEPPALLAQALVVNRSERGDEVVVTLAEPGRGTLTVTSTSHVATKTVQVPLQVDRD